VQWLNGQTGICDAPSLPAMLGVMVQKVRQATARLTVRNHPLPVPAVTVPSEHCEVGRTPRP
jgi:hypothetical protein